MIDHQAVVKLGAGSRVGNSVPLPTAEEFSITALAVPSFSTAVRAVHPPLPLLRSHQPPTVTFTTLIDIRPTP